MFEGSAVSLAVSVLDSYTTLDKHQLLSVLLVTCVTSCSCFTLC